MLMGWLVGWCTMPECRYYIGHSGCNYHIRTNCKCDVPGYNGALIGFRHALHGVANTIGRNRKFTNCIVKKTVYYMTNGARTIYYQGHTCAQSHTHTHTNTRAHAHTYKLRVLLANAHLAGARALQHTHSRMRARERDQFNDRRWTLTLNFIVHVFALERRTIRYELAGARSRARSPRVPRIVCARIV